VGGTVFELELARRSCNSISSILLSFTAELAVMAENAVALSSPPSVLLDATICNTEALIASCLALTASCSSCHSLMLINPLRVACSSSCTCWTLLATPANANEFCDVL
jgi:hypothetical protein